MLLVFSRPFTKKFTDCYKKSYNGDVLFISDFKGYGDCDVMTSVYSAFNNLSEEEFYSELDYRDIISRDRYLRYQKPDLSKKLVNGFWSYLIKLFDDNVFSAYIGMPVDNYVQHLIVLMCQRKGVNCISPVHSPIHHKLRVTNLGEYIHVRTPEKEEVSDIIQSFSKKDFKPVWLSKHRGVSDVLYLYAKERVKKLIFSIKKLINNDPYSFHYNCIYPMKGAITVHSLDVLQSPKLFQKDIEVVKRKFKGYKNVAYLALQFNPEASINYLISDPGFSQYDLVIEKILETLPADTLLLVKEHPDIYGYRPLKFYNKFLNRDNVCLLDPSISTSLLIDLVDFVLVTGGASTGIEAVVKNKTVISFGGAFYQYKDVIYEVKEFCDVEKWTCFLERKKNTEELVYEFIEYVLSNTLDANYEGLVRSKNDYDPINVETTKTLLNSLGL